MKHTVHTLKNGLRVISCPMPGVETAAVMVMTGTGSRYENEHENGLAHFLEHMFFKGTIKRPSAQAISEELDAVGSYYNAYTAKERTGYYAKVAARYFDVALDVISDIALNSTLPANEIEKERGAVLQEIDMYEDMPMRTVDNVFDALIFKTAEGTEHPLARTILGPKENIRSFTQQNFSEYLKRNYTPQNTVVCVAGAFDEQIALGKIEDDFGKVSEAAAPTFLPYSALQQEARVSIREKMTDQTHVMLGVPAYPYGHKDEYVQLVLNTVLGQGMSSRLFSEVREKRGLAYSIHSWIERYTDVAYLAAQAGVEHGKLEETIKTVLGEFKKLREEKVPDAELKKAKSYLKGSTALHLETSDEIANYAATSMINLGRVRAIEEISEGVDAVNAEDIQRVAKDIFQTKRLNLAIIGPHNGKTDQFIALLNA